MKPRIRATGRPVRLPRLFRRRGRTNGSRPHVLVSGVFNEANPESSTRHIETITLHVEAVSPPCSSSNSSVGGLPHLITMGSYVHPMPRPRRDPAWRRVLSWLGAAGVALSKLKFLASASSMLVSIGAYALIWGFRFGVGFVFLLLVHE